MDKKKILIVDDEEIIRDLTKKVFTAEGYSVRLAGSAEDAMGILRKESIMVMFLDILLPEMNGIELCGWIRKQNPVAILYAITGYANLYNLLDCRKAGFDDFITKPASIELLLELAQSAFKKIERWQVNEYDLM